MGAFEFLLQLNHVRGQTLQAAWTGDGGHATQVLQQRLGLLVLGLELLTQLLLKQRNDVG